LILTVLLFSVSSVSYIKVTAQSSGTNTEKPAAEKGKCSAGEAGCLALLALAHKKENATSAEKPAAETGTCSAGQIKDWAGICFKESEAKACPTCAPGSAAAAEKSSTLPPPEKPAAEKPGPFGCPPGHYAKFGEHGERVGHHHFCLCLVFYTFNPGSNLGELNTHRF
jgi:hypothetical protein